MLHRFAKLLAGCTVFLVLAGSLVTSTDSGLSVPDWPTTYGWSMFTFPPSKWVGGIFYEHSHRLIASTVGFLTILLAIWLWRSEPRRWMRWLGVAALGAVVAQGVLGGLTVLFFLPAPVSTAHAGLADANAALGQLEAAISEMRKVLTQDVNGSYHYRIAKWYQQTGHAEEARAAFAETARIKAKIHAGLEGRLTLAPAR